MISRAILFLLAGFFFAGCASSSGLVENPALDLVGTRWRITYTNSTFGHRDYDLFFKPEGQLLNTHPDNKTPANDTWKLSGRKITLRFHNGYAVYVGQLTDSDHMAGTATSDSGGVWSWTATRWGPPLQLALP
jgi:hypothetical protein